LTTDYLYRNFFASFARLALKHPGTHNIGKHTLPNGREDLVAATIEVFAEDNLIVAFSVRSGI
jgi:hypothetical protein